MKIVVFILCLGLVSGQQIDTHLRILAAIDSVFKNNDANGNGILELYELENAYMRVDANHDQRISEAEYTSRATNHDFIAIVFRELDYDGDGYLNTGSIYGQYEVMDKNHDNEVSRQEFDLYYTGVIESAIRDYGHLLPPDIKFPTNQPVTVATTTDGTSQASG